MNNLGYIIGKLYPSYVRSGAIEVRDDGNGPYIHTWDDAAGVMPSAEELEAAQQQLLVEGTIEAIDLNAYGKIIKIAPEHVQRNMTARGAELLEKIVEGGTLSTEEQAERLAIKDIWARIKTIRVHAKYLKEEVLAGNNPNIEEGWPE